MRRNLACIPLHATLIIALLAAPVLAGEPYDMKKCLNEGRYCVDGDPADIFDAIYDIRDPKKMCICQDNPPKNSLRPPEPAVDFLALDSGDVVEVTIDGGRDFDEVALVADGTHWSIDPASLPHGWSVSTDCGQKNSPNNEVELRGTPTRELSFRVNVPGGSTSFTPETSLHQTFWTSDADFVADTKSNGEQQTQNDGLWDLGQLAAGKIYPTTVAAVNESCRGKHTFEIFIEGEDFLQVAGESVLEKIKVGQSKTAEAVIDLRDVTPGEHHAQLHVRCLTCPPPPKCTVNNQVLDVRVEVVAASEQG